MEMRMCPICLKRGLMPLKKYEPQKNEEILCSNDDYIHVRRFENEYLAHTVTNMLTEMVSPLELVLN